MMGKQTKFSVYRGQPLSALSHNNNLTVGQSNKEIGRKGGRMEPCTHQTKCTTACYGSSSFFPLVKLFLPEVNAFQQFKEALLSNCDTIYNCGTQKKPPQFICSRSCHSSHVGNWTKISDMQEIHLIIQSQVIYRSGN